MSTNVVELKNIKKSFKKQDVLKDVSITLKEGMIYGFVGRNGSGKSVLFKIICGLVLPTSGTVTVNGKTLKKGAFAEDVGILLDNTGFIGRMTAFDNLKSIAIIQDKLSDDEIRDAISMVGLVPDSRQRAGKFSLGMKQRLGIAQALMEKPKLLLLDEPMNGLDESGVKEIRSILKAYVKERGATILIASHNKEDIDELCDEVYQVKEGKVEKV